MNITSVLSLGLTGLELAADDEQKQKVLDVLKVAIKVWEEKKELSDDWKVITNKVLDLHTGGWQKDAVHAFVGANQSKAASISSAAAGKVKK